MVYVLLLGNSNNAHNNHSEKLYKLFLMFFIVLATVKIIRKAFTNITDTRNKL
jgi:hypothetical protein